MKDEDLLKEAKENYKEASDGWRQIFDEAREDMEFVYDVGEGQWPDEVRKTRGDRPCITVNKLQRVVRQVRGDMLQNRPRMKVIPVDSVADPQVAELYNGLIRQIEYLSSADIAYDTAYGAAIASSVGFWRIATQYEDEYSANQEIRIKRIIDPCSVIFDPCAKEFTLEDASYCFIEENITKRDFKRLYRQELQGWDGEQDIYGDWLDNEQVRIAEYFWKDFQKKRIGILNDGSVIELNKANIDRIQGSGIVVARERDTVITKVKWCKMTGNAVLEKGDWPGMNIPIIPVFGDEIIARGKKYYLSLIRSAKGAQRMFNYWSTAATENVALSPKSPFIVDHRQLKGFEREWEDANVSNKMFIRYNAIAGLNKPSREPQTQVPNAIIGMLQQTAYDIEDILGRYEASKGQASNERSGKAIAERVKQSDKGTYAFVDNFTRAMVYSCRQLVDLIPKIYDTERAVRIMGEGGEQQQVAINQPVIGAIGKVNDLSVGKYDLIATTGNASESKRAEMVQSMMEAAQYAPDIAPYIVPLIFKYSDWPGAQEVFSEVQRGMQQSQMQETE